MLTALPARHQPHAWHVLLQEQPNITIRTTAMKPVLREPISQVVLAMTATPIVWPVVAQRPLAPVVNPKEGTHFYPLRQAVLPVAIAATYLSMQNARNVTPTAPPVWLTRPLVLLARLDTCMAANVWPLAQLAMWPQVRNALGVTLTVLSAQLSTLRSVSLVAQNTYF